MGAHKMRRKSSGHTKTDDRSSGVFAIPESARVVRRGSTQVVEAPADDGTHGRGRSHR
jgi:hypothetical protein